MDRRSYPEKARERIKASKIIDRLREHVNGKIELSATQVNAARILLNKTLPDLKAIELSGDVGSKPAQRMDSHDLNSELGRVRALLGAVGGEEEADIGEGECGSVH